MTKETADIFIKSNTEYTKLKGSDSSTPREQPRQQKAGNVGHHLPEHQRWTTEELRKHADGLGIIDCNDMTRNELLSAINKQL